ncbi:hypothetical protein DAEQUDRAFT_729843 [Daedalea quercina L-15889]|uniref:Uncharacterized protein n=1 Tax=Daedalea quercina L-15889 TaxID=1314783 RepID=A0A165NAP6_9APHY|nr:hypothetical protein DAEQUDRAFT_729843 [Daedalea quercina L-15889]
MKPSEASQNGPSDKGTRKTRVTASTGSGRTSDAVVSSTSGNVLQIALPEGEYNESPPLPLEHHTASNVAVVPALTTSIGKHAHNYNCSHFTMPTRGVVLVLLGHSTSPIRMGPAGSRSFLGDRHGVCDVERNNGHGEDRVDGRFTHESEEEEEHEGAREVDGIANDRRGAHAVEPK